jgi:Putative addiction module component
MTCPAKDIVNVAKRLPESNRLEFVEELLASLEPPGDKDIDAAWPAEVERRSRGAGNLEPGVTSLTDFDESNINELQRTTFFDFVFSLRGRF